MNEGSLSELLEERGDEEPLSEDSEQEILEMVEEQLDRPNPPDTKVLYRRAMYFIDRDVRHLSLQQFNAKFPLRVKRRRARERAGASSSRSARGARSAATGGAETSRSRGGEGESGGRNEDRNAASSRGNDDARDRRDRVRSALLDYARLVGGADGRDGLIDAVRRVDEYVDRVVED